MRILHTESSIGWGGRELRIINEMEQMQLRGHHVILACKKPSPIWDAANRKRLKLVNIPFTKSLPSWEAIKIVKHLILSEKIEIANTHSSVDSWVVSIAAKLTNTICIKSRHLCSPLKNDILHRLYHRYLIDAFITTGEKLRQDLIVHNDIESDRVISIPSGVEERYLSNDGYDKQAIRKKLNIDPSAFVWCMTAFIRKMKGHSVLLDAIALLQPDFPNTHYIFVGGVNQQTTVSAQLLEQANRLGISEKCHFLGTRTDVPEILAGCNAFVLPSLFTEGLPQGLTQAMAMGLPAVSTDVGAITEVLRDGETGYLAEPRNPKNLAHVMKLVMVHSKEAQKRAATGQELVRNCYSLEAMVDKVETFYDQRLQQ